MHPDVCAFVSERSYDAKLHSRDACARCGGSTPTSGTLTGAACARSPSNTRAAARQAQRRRGDRCRLPRSCSRARRSPTTKAWRARLEPDILVVAPYNLAVHCIREHVPAGVRVGTVDRFQGQAGAGRVLRDDLLSGEDVPRGIDFLFDANRFNVAISRAQCLARARPQPTAARHRMPFARGDGASRRRLPVRRARDVTHTVRRLAAK